MSKTTKIKAPSRREKLTLRIMILFGLLSLLYFFYWFLNPNLIESKILFWILFISITYDTLKILYIWYHYWDISIPQKPEITSDLTVDVLTTYFPGEPYEMIKETLLAIKRMKYPHTTYLCDEANDPYLKNFCEENNIIHVTRTNRINAKAGNINNALLQAKGDICLILDPDHVPFENFLEEVLPYFADERIGFVQTVQAYYNVKESTVAKGAAEQTFHFYGPVMMCMNSYGTVNAIGANCVFRRKALDSIGGHAAGLSEDMHTAMQLHAKGWKSIYVPRIFTKGLVPASLTAYYKQQLKWSRGTWELLVAVYPKLFGKFTWRQKLHYAILPFHYFSGVSYLINFLIPIFSLFFATTPWKGNIVNFALVFVPVLISILGIRFYVQRWVMYKSERGIHLIGGLLQTCSWWITNLGLIYTLIRKKVPYLPTPKDDKDTTSWKILLPNLFIGIVSVIAVIYGLSIDYTPFSLFMSCFAFLNAFFMFYTLYFAYQKPKIITLQQNLADQKDTRIERIQNFLFHVWRKLALPVIVIGLITSAYFQYDLSYGKWQGVKPEVQNKHLLNYLGIFAPKADNGITSLKNVKELSVEIKENFDIISLYIPWEKKIDSNFPNSLIDSIYKQKSIPMITWEPWLNSFGEEETKGKHVFELITEGYFDDYIHQFSDKLKNLQRPVFLRFAHEFDNPFYPWYVGDDADPSDFKKAWVHTYEIFKKYEANNVIWIWNPWKSTNLESFYPGEEYVDWIGVNILNYGKLNQDGEWHDFVSLYKPFHDKLKNLPSTPVIISEFGSLNNEQRQEEWIKKAFESIENEFSEVRSVIYFNSKVDDNLPVQSHLHERLDWTINENQEIKNSFSKKEIPDYVFSTMPQFETGEKNLGNKKKAELGQIKGINLKKGHDWRKDYYVFNRKNLQSDFGKLKNLGLNTIKFVGHTVYDYNILNVAKDYHLNVAFGFWISEDIDFVADTAKTSRLKQSILSTIKSYKSDRNILFWNIQNDVQYNQKDYFLKPRLFYQNSAYLAWLKELVQEIKKIDSSRPLVVDLEVNLQTIYHAQLLMNNIDGIDYLGLVVKDVKHLTSVVSYLKQTEIDYCYSEIGVPNLSHDLLETKLPFFVNSWRDQHESNKLTFDGIIDRNGRYKIDFFNLRNVLQNSDRRVEFPKIRILKPASLIYEGNMYDYFAMYNDPGSGWKNGNEIGDLNFEWSLIKCDKFGNFLAVKDVGKGDKLSLVIPDNPDYYRLLLTTIYRDTISTTITRLNTPLIGSKESFK